MRRPKHPPTSPISPSRASGPRASPKRPSSTNRQQKSRQQKRPRIKQPTSPPRPRASLRTRGGTSPRRARKPSPRRCPRRRLWCRWLPRQMSSPRQTRQSRRQRLRRSAATPTISPVPRSSACAASPTVRRVRRKPLAPQIHPAPPMRPGSRRRRRPKRLVSCPRHRSGRFRRRSWSPRLPVTRSIRRQHRRRENRLPPTPRESATPAARRRQPIFRSRRRSICVPRRRNRRRGNTGTLPKTCCRRRNRRFTPSCRNNSERIVVLPGLAADARKAALRGFILGADADRAAIGAGGLGLVAEAFIGKPPGRPDLRVVRVGLRGLVEVGGGFLDLVEREITDRAAKQRFGPLRRQAVRRGKIVDRELVPLFALIEQAATV